MVSIYSYTDYRLFLNDFYLRQKKSERRFSYRAMAARLGFTAPNFLKLVIDGKRNISRESIDKIAAGCSLGKGEAEYFSYLVFFTQAKDPVEKNYYFGLIAALRARTTGGVISAEQFEYFSRWYNPVVRELVVGLREPLDFTHLSQRMNGVVSPARIRLSVKQLLRLGFLKFADDGTYSHNVPVLNTGNELNSFAVRQYHEQVLDIARRSLHSIPPPEREIASVTAHLSESGFKKFKRRLQEFRQELLQMAADDADPQQVYHINLQLYPLTRSVNDENKQ